MARKFLYSVTTGRSGTVFLNALLRENLPEATVFHERVGFPNFGVHTPDGAHSTGFNSVGNIDMIREFWKRKLELDAQCQTEVFIEISHILAKAGLIENLGYLPDDSDIHIVGLKRDPFKIFWSFVNRFDFFNPGFTWLFTLDSRYRNVIIDGAPYREQGMMGSALWYVREVFARIEYYRLLTRDVPNITFHQVNLEEVVTPEGAVDFLTSFLGEAPEEVRIPGRKNATKQEFFGEKEKEAGRKLMEKIPCNPVKEGRSYFESGKRLGTPER